MVPNLVPTSAHLSAPQRRLERGENPAPVINRTGRGRSRRLARDQGFPWTCQGLLESLIASPHDERVTASSAPGRSSARLLFRLAVIVMSVVAAIVGSVLLATQRRSSPTGSTLASALPPGGKVVALIRIGRSNVASGRLGAGPLAVGEGAVWAMNVAKATLMRIDPTRNAIVARIKVRTPEAAAAGDGAVWLSTPVLEHDHSRRSGNECGHCDHPGRSTAGGHRRLAGRRLGRKRGGARASHGSIPPRIASSRRFASARRATVVRSTCR